MSKKTVIILAIIIFVVGNITGFFLGVFTVKGAQSFLISLFENEKAADVKGQNEIARSDFNLKYPSNWKIDTADEDYDPDCLFSIDSPGSSHVMFIVYDTATDPEENIKNQIKAHSEKLIKNPGLVYFNRWGQYDGTGVELKGRVLGVLKGAVRIFSYSNQARSFVVVEFSYDEDLKLVGPGFKLIESTFCLK